MAEFEIVERPEHHLGFRLTEESRAFLATLNSGKAVRIPLAGRSLDSVRSRLISIAHNRKLKARTVADGDHVIAWCEPKQNGNGGQP